MRTLYTFFAKDYKATMYAHADTLIEVFWVEGKGTGAEASGSFTTKASHAQSSIWKYEEQGYSVESIRVA